MLTAWVLVAGAALVHLDTFQAPRTFFFDEWAFVFDRRSGGLSTFLEPHNGHLSALPVAAFRLLFGVFGMDRYRPYRLMGLLVHVAVATAAYRYCRARLGEIAGIATGALVLWLGIGWQNIFWPFQIGYMGSVASGIVAWNLLAWRSRRGDVGAAIAIVVSLSCSGLGISIAAGTGALLVAERAWRRILVVLSPSVVLYGIWYLAYGTSQGQGSNVPRLPRFVVDSAAGAAGGLFGRDLLWGRLLAGVLVGFGVALVCTRRRLPVTLIAPAVAAIVNWALTGYSRADEVPPDASRYAYVGAILVLLVAVDVCRPFERRVVRYAVAAVALMGIWGNAAVMDVGAGGLQSVTAVTRAELRALEWAAAAVDVSYRPDTSRMPQVVAGEYLDAMADLGSAAASDGEIAVASEETRAEVDRVTLEIAGVRGLDGGVTTLPASADPPAACGAEVPVADGVAAAAVSVTGGQRLVIVAGPAVVEVRLRRYASSFATGPTVMAAAGGSALLTVPLDTAPVQTWMVEARSSTGFQLCS